MAHQGNFPLTWDLDSLYPHPGSEEFQSLFSVFADNLRGLAERSESLPVLEPTRDCASAWSRFLQEYETISGRMRELDAFVGCYAAAESENKLFQQLEARISSLQPLREQISTNVELALKGATTSTLDQFVAHDDWLQKNLFYLQEGQRNAAFRLPKAQELLAADLGVDGIHAWGRLYDRISGALRIRVMEKGEIVEKSPGQVMFDSPQRSVRENNFYAADRAWSAIADTCADALNHISGTRLTLYRRLGAQDHLNAPLRSNRLQRKTLEAMWSAVSERKEMLLDYFAAKARLLGLEKLCWYDTVAPLPQTSGTSGGDTLSYDAACETVVSTFNGFSPELGDFAHHAMQNGWIEAENRAGKRQGGFCTGFPLQQQSRIFMTYTNSADSMSTLAHELGHAYHSFVLKEQPLFLRRYPMNLAETASTFAEAVLGEERLRSAKSPRKEMSILEAMLGDAAVYLMNIHARFVFEDNFHRERHHGEVSAERFSELMLEAQKATYQGALDDNGWHPRFWISKLHFYISELAFYNFPYTFGYLLSLGIYALAGELGDKFPQKYREFLIATGCLQTEDAIQSTFGNDATASAFWHKSLDVIEVRVKRFVELAEQLSPSDE